MQLIVNEIWIGEDVLLSVLIVNYRALQDHVRPHTHPRLAAFTFALRDSTEIGME